MAPTLNLLACVLAVAQPQRAIEAQPGPHLQRGQELVYTGSFREECLGQGVQFSRHYRIENRILVLDVTAHGADVALFTILRPHGRQSSSEARPDALSVRLEAAHVNGNGRLSGEGLTLPLDGPALVESGAFVEWPPGRLIPGKAWETAEPNRPPRFWQVAGSEVVNGARCSRIECLQVSDDWDRPRADTTAWRRHDVFWILPALGVAMRVERTIERREPARREPGQRFITTLDLDSRVVYPGPLLDDREREINQCRNLMQELAAAFRTPESAPSANWDSALAQIAYHMDNQPATPYRESLVALKKRIEAARRGDSAPVAVAEEIRTAPVIASVGQLAPDFVASELTGRESVRLRRLAGRPVVLLFYAPGTRTASETLRFAQKMHDENRASVHVVGLALTEDTDRVLREHKTLGLTIPVLSGIGLRVAYAVEATPRWVVLDSAGIVQASYTGWGDEIPALIANDVRRCRNTEQEKKEKVGELRPVSGPG